MDNRALAPHQIWGAQPFYAIYSFQAVSEVTELIGSNSHGKLVVLVDDNMYYHSMRLQFYKLARNSKSNLKAVPIFVDLAGFAICYLDTPIDVCLARNSTFWAMESYLVQVRAKIAWTGRLY